MRGANGNSASWLNADVSWTGLDMEIEIARELTRSNFAVLNYEVTHDCEPDGPSPARVALLIALFVVAASATLATYVNGKQRRSCGNLWREKAQLGRWSHRGSAGAQQLVQVSGLVHACILYAKAFQFQMHVCHVQ